MCHLSAGSARAKCLPVVRRAIRRFANGLGTVSADVVSAPDRSAGTLLRTGGATPLRTAQRAETIGARLASVATFSISTAAALTVLGELGIDPLVAGVGIALGFGARNLVGDFLSGIFMLIEDHYGVGDVIDVGPTEWACGSTGRRSRPAPRSRKNELVTAGWNRG